MNIKTIALLGAALAVTACETTSSRPYQASTQNVMAAQRVAKAEGIRVQVGEFAAAEGVKTEPTCRALGALEVAPGKTPIEYVESAFRDELFAAGAIDAAGTEIEATVTELSFNSFGTGKWTVAMNVRSDAMPEGYDVSTQYEFKTSFSAIKACQNVVDAFQPTVAELLNQVVTHPEFPTLAGGQSGTAVASR